MDADGDRLGALLGELMGLLEDERRILLGGTPEEITAMTRRKLALAGLVEQETAASPQAPRPAPDALRRLARYNQENAVICSAMLRHLTAALDRLRRHDLHRSYNADGSEQPAAARHALGAA